MTRAGRPVRTPPGWIRGLLAGTFGTAVMATTTTAESRLRRRRDPVDFDDSLVLVHVAERILAISPSGRAERALNQAMRFGYGAVAGLVRHVVDGRVARPRPVVFAITWGAEVVGLSVTGTAPAPWRWPPDVLASSIVQHGVYAWATDAAYRRLGEGRRPWPT